VIGRSIDPDALAALQAALDGRRVSADVHVLDSYAAQPFHKVEPGVWVHRPIAVCLPDTVAEVQAIVRICNEHGVRYKALSTGWGAHAGPGFDDVVQIDLRRMNSILELDVDNRVIVVEPYVTCAQIQAELMPLGLNIHIHGAGSNCSPLASATSHMGMGFSSISMGYAPRNIMGVEWILPTGELLRVGSFGSGAGWVSPDGPGPSLRGVMRGWAGADGGFGVFTKCALKLYPWSGPAEPEWETAVDGTRRVKVPPDNCLYACVFPTLESYGEALYAVGDAEIGYLHAKIAPGLSTAIRDASGFKTNRHDPRFRAMVRGTRHQFLIALQGNSDAHFAYQDNVLREIVTANGGVVLDVSAMPIGSGIGGGWWELVRNSVAPSMFRPTGNFYSTLGGDEAIASALRQDAEGEKLKEGFIEDGWCEDDLADNAHSLLYEHGLFAHTEELLLFDHRDPDQAKHLKELSDTMMRTIPEKVLGGGGFSFFAGGYAHDYLGPRMGGYHRWQRAVKTAFDPQDASDSKYFINSDPESVKSAKEARGRG